MILDLSNYEPLRYFCTYRKRDIELVDQDVIIDWFSSPEGHRLRLITNSIFESISIIITVLPQRYIYIYMHLCFFFLFLILLL